MSTGGLQPLMPQVSLKVLFVMGSYMLGGFKKALGGVFCRSTQTRFGFLFWALWFGFWGSDFWSVTPTFGL